MAERHRPEKFLEDWMDHRGEKKKWEKLWLVLRGTGICIFKSQQTTEENFMGLLRLDARTSLKTEGSKPPFKFELVTYSRDGQKRINNFKCNESNKRDLWKAFILGVAKRSIPQDVHLLPGQVQQVMDAIEKLNMSNMPPPVNTSSHPVNMKSSQSVCSSEWSPSMADTSQRDSLQSSQSSGSGSGSGIGYSVNEGSLYTMDLPGIPNVRGHKIYLDSQRNQELPSWFFDDCSREKAEEVLDKGRKSGNVLMRQSITNRDMGNYVISLQRENYRGGPPSVYHYQIANTPSGMFKLQLNEDDQELKCLGDVMDHFVNMAGPNTLPMTTNNWSILGVKEPDYNTKAASGFVPTWNQGNTKNVKRISSESAINGSPQSSNKSQAQSQPRGRSQSSSSWQTSTPTKGGWQEGETYYNLEEYFPKMGETPAEPKEYVNEDVIESISANHNQANFSQESCYYNADDIIDARRNGRPPSDSYYNEQDIWEAQAAGLQARSEQSPAVFCAPLPPPAPPQPPPTDSIPRHRTDTHGNLPQITLNSLKTIVPVHQRGPDPQNEMIGELEKKLHLRRTIIEGGGDEYDPCGDVDTNANNNIEHKIHGFHHNRSETAPQLSTPGVLQRVDNSRRGRQASEPDFSSTLQQQLSAHFIYSTPEAFNTLLPPNQN